MLQLIRRRGTIVTAGARAAAAAVEKPVTVHFAGPGGVGARAGWPATVTVGPGQV
jgi:hypothetical protein